MGIVCVLIFGLGAALLFVVARSQRLSEDLLERDRQLERLQAEQKALSNNLLVVVDEDKKKDGWLEHLEQKVGWLEAELAKRPRITRKTYKILTLGLKATGKTSLTLKWSNPLVDLGVLEGTKIERYERTVSHVLDNDIMTHHVFEVGDWGGEHIVDALHELMVDEIHGLLIVADLAGKDGKRVDPARVEEQLREFQPQTLKYFFGRKTLASCKAVVLFINKSDVLPGTPAEVEEQAKKLYAPLIENLQRYSSELDIRVFVGSASYGHSTHLLFSHFVERILPKSAYDSELLQRLNTAAAVEAEEKTAPLPASRGKARAA
ncbi:hypothetical protein [Polyangium spumosum]|uniref:hypothetical protein n=1 Tax=Polyangium spumosum TaxID=889282 RepID=UPI001F0E95EC|nr:hypothetical protein [Polyangium spumosum]